MSVAESIHLVPQSSVAAAAAVLKVMWRSGGGCVDVLSLVLILEFFIQFVIETEFWLVHNDFFKNLPGAIWTYKAVT